MLLWVSEDELDEHTRAAIDSADDAFVSAASIWEIEIKRALEKMSSPGDLVEQVEKAGFERMSISLMHATEAARLPMHHRDPFDRMLVAQARLEGLTLATADGALAAYDVPIFEAARA